MPTMQTICKIEFRKLLHRKDLWLILSMLAIPALYSIGIYTHSSVITFNGTDKEYAMSFFVNMFHFVYALYIYFFVLSLISVRSLGGEIENRNILLYTQRINERKKLYQAKVTALTAMVLGVSAVFFVFSMLMFYLFAVHRTDLISSRFMVSNEFLSLILWFLSIVLAYILTIHFSLMLSTFLKFNTAVIIFILVLIASAFMSKFPIVSFLSIHYYIEQFGALDLSDSGGALRLFGINLAVVFLYSLVCKQVGVRRFERRDL
ncbi:hypothetical protein [Saccharibacillus sacchari]|uniref:Uncharacterized protein n=1 Tax=Saccharibacillus sacchari TaxID=456493 RepID=A0ACC6P902_9BACL